ncbi:MAG TPA: phosphatidate cytidylyltransferase [Vicinamibacteria bacterium]|nr:phosphatidate cytidylyltransferase [Vicinamibacteria bacterium]
MSADTAGSAPPEPLPPQRLRAPGFLPNLVRRVLTAAVALPAVLAVLLLLPPWATLALVACALAAGLHEFFGLLAARGLRPLRGSGLLLAAAVFADVAWPASARVPLSPLGVLLVLTVALLRGRDHESVSAAAGTLLGAVYLGGLGGTLAGLRTLPSPAGGSWRVVLLLATIVLSDTFAFFVGHAVGRRRLAPAISPGKSVEGALGGLLGGVVGVFAVRQLALPQMPAAHALILGLLVSAMGILGDLEESLLKRWAGVKDSGTLFPGHGGMLDRLDSLLFGAPVLYYYFQHLR